MNKCVGFFYSTDLLYLQSHETFNLATTKRARLTVKQNYRCNRDTKNGTRKAFFISLFTICGSNCFSTSLSEHRKPQMLHSVASIDNIHASEIFYLMVYESGMVTSIFDPSSEQWFPSSFSLRFP
jgi:hypothetical protein